MHSWTPPPFKKKNREDGLTLPKSQKSGMEKLDKCNEDPKKGSGSLFIIMDSVAREDTFSVGILSSWGVTNVTAVTFNYIFVHSVPVFIECRCQSLF